MWALSVFGHLFSALLVLSCVAKAKACAVLMVVFWLTTSTLITVSSLDLVWSDWNE